LQAATARGWSKIDMRGIPRWRLGRTPGWHRMVSGRLTASHHRAALVSAATGAASALALAGQARSALRARRPRLLPAWTPQVECSCRLLRLAVLAVLWNCVDYRYGLGLFLLDVA
jgi:hypothetical protein